MIVFKRLIVAAGGAVCAAIVTAADAQDYPSKPARFVVGYPPGGANDLIARITAQKLGELWSQQFIVENRPGASAVIGTEAVAHAAPDGYTLGLVNLSPMVLARFHSRRCPTTAPLISRPSRRWPWRRC